MSFDRSLPPSGMQHSMMLSTDDVELEELPGSAVPRSCYPSRAPALQERSMSASEADGHVMRAGGLLLSHHPTRMRVQVRDLEETSRRTPQMAR